MLNASLAAMKRALAALASGGHPASEQLLPFDELYRECGFDGHYAWEAQFEAGSM